MLLPRRTAHNAIRKPKDFDDFVIEGSSKGWLIMRSEENIFLLNLFSNIRVDLPPLSLVVDHIPMSDSKEDMEMMDIPICFAISTCPNLNSIPMASVTFEWCLIWCKMGYKTWKRYQSDYEYGNIVFHNEKLYAIDRDGTRIDVFKVDDESLVLVPIPHSILIPTNENPISDTFEVYMVDSNGRLLVVKRYNISSMITSHTIGFEVLMVQEDETNNSSPNVVVINLDTLEDQALFVSHLRSESIPSNNYSGHQKGRIYFVGHGELGVYAFKDMRILRVTLAPNDTFSYPIWVLLRFAFPCNCKLHDSTILRKQEHNLINLHQEEKDVARFSWEIDVNILSLV